MKTMPKVLAVASLGSLIALGALAQSSQQPGPESSPSQRGAAQQIPQAPIGHRQPNASDVPPSVLQSEGERSEQDKKLDKALDICRGC